MNLEGARRRLVWGTGPLTLVLLASAGAACSPETEAEADAHLARQRPRGSVPGASSTSPPSLPSKGLTPLTGGTLTIMRGEFAAASDPDRSLVSFVDLTRRRLVGSVTLPAGSQPTRSAEDGEGNLQVLLRGTGQVATLSRRTMSVLSLDRVCAEPRGITWDPVNRRTIVACASGELISRPLEGAETVTRLGHELRDVMVRSGGVIVSTFRGARLLSVSADGSSTARPLAAPPRIPFGTFENAPVAFVPNTAWKTLALPNGNIAMVHQRSVDGDVRATTELAGPEFVTDTTTTSVPRVVGRAYYGGDIVVMDPVNRSVERRVCTTGVVRSAVTVFDPRGLVRGSHEVLGILPIDAAVSPDGTELVVAAAGNHQVTRVALQRITGLEGKACGPPQASGADDRFGQPTGVAYRPDGALVVHSRQPPMLLVLSDDDTVIDSYTLPGSWSASTPGHTVFHTSPRAVACASCHPEGGDDGHVWRFPGEVRRTQPLTGGLSKTAPFHWAGNRADMAAIMSDTFVDRMGGAPPDSSAVADLTAFLDALPAPSASAPQPPPARLSQGQLAFATVGCDTCHGGPLMTNNATVDVGTGAPFQVPSLIGLGARAPYMHDGCATTMRERFTKPGCGGSKHGDVSKLSADDLDALVDYLTGL
ncbi:MAG: hypothetical protein Q8S33_30895 [Myxococcales bacterium]|nr:hypothetical protein [Myxococcales bacterium]